MSEPSPQSGFLLVMSGPSGVGKSTLSRRLAEGGRIAYAVSVTTRPKKQADAQGKTYEHVPPEEFFRRLDGDEFLEYAQVYGDYYGTPKRPTLDQLQAGRNVLLEIDVQGALQVRHEYPGALLIFILPPDEPTLLQRLKDRGRDSPEEISRRFRDAKREIHMAQGSRAYDAWVVNDNVDNAVEKIFDIVRRKHGGI
jgi:guanylate kinase